MKPFTLFLLAALLLGFSGGGFAQDDKPLRAIKTEVGSPTAAPATPQASAKDISASPGVLASAACCLKQCAGGGSCGQNCQVVDSLSQCGAVNFKFECPADKGMACLGSSCSCQ